MNNLKLHQTEIKDDTGCIIRLEYNESDDILEIFFDKNEPSTGIELTDQLLLRINQESERAVSLTILHFSILTERTEYGIRSYPLHKLEELPEQLREQVIRIITSPPVNKFLKTSFFQESPSHRLPLAFVEPYGFASVA